ncbi:MAG: sigma-70 family RNA polymerase sigma factor [Bacteroidaceae bacterium]|nr:sigma-70 family RNA polymerase sigma factor [Bacteroidaceae bacterium]
MEATESVTVYRQALKRLPYNWQKILVMRGEDEMSYTEIAQILGTTESSVRGTISKAKKKILELIKQEL